MEDEYSIRVGPCRSDPSTAMLALGPEIPSQAFILFEIPWMDSDVGDNIRRNEDEDWCMGMGDVGTDETKEGGKAGEWGSDLAKYEATAPAAPASIAQTPDDCAPDRACPTAEVLLLGDVEAP